MTMLGGQRVLFTTFRLQATDAEVRRPGAAKGNDKYSDVIG